jgi:hypothetical protein
MKTAAEVTRMLRDHKLNHGGLQCPVCDLWNIYTRGSVDELDAFIARVEAGEGTAISSELIAAARVLRAEWGEAGWTAKDVVA